MGDQGKALAEGLYWMAEKLMWGYEDTDINPVEAFKVYKRAADLGFSDAGASGARQGDGTKRRRGPRQLPASRQGRELSGIRLHRKAPNQDAARRKSRPLLE